MTKGIDITQEKMPSELQTKLELLSPFSRKYAEYRAKGLKQADASSKAGSKANGRAALSRVGWNTEQQDGVKEYILWLEHKRAKASVIDNIEIIDKLRQVYESALIDGKYSDANKAAELLGSMIGAFHKGKQQEVKTKTELDVEAKTKTNTKAFQEDLEDSEPDIRIKKLQKMLRDAKMIVKD